MPLVQRKWEWFVHLVNEPRDARPAAYVRAAIGAAALLRAQEAYGILFEVLRPNQFRLPYVLFMPDLSLTVMPWLVGIWAMLAFCFSVGFQSKISGIGLALVMTYVLLLDEQTYSNHLYLLTIATVLLVLGNAGAAFSMDAVWGKNKPTKAATVPNWLVLLLRFQLSMVYFWGSLAKLTIPFLTGGIVREFSQPSVLSWLHRTGLEEAILMSTAVAAIVMELFLSIAIWIPRLRYTVLSIGVLLHGGMIALFWNSEVATQIEIFAFVSLALYLPTLLDNPKARPEQHQSSLWA